MRPLPRPLFRAAIRPGLRLVLCLACLSGCAAAGLPRPGVLPPIAARFEDRVWLETTPGAAEGAFRAFLSDGSMVTGSCASRWGTSAWRRIDASRLVWDGPDGRVPAEIAAAGPRELALLVDPEGAGETLTFRRAEPPFACQ